MFGMQHTLKQLSGGIAIAAALAVIAVPAASASSFITDTLGGNGSPKAQPDVFLLAKLLGHSEARTTKLYSHLLPDHLARARNAVSLAPQVGPSSLEAGKRWEGKKAKRTSNAGGS